MPSLAGTLGSFADHRVCSATRQLASIPWCPKSGVRQLMGKALRGPKSRLEKCRSDLSRLALLDASRSRGWEVNPAVFGPSGVDVAALRVALEMHVRGSKRALAMLEDHPRARAEDIGLVLREAQGATWTSSTTQLAGKQFRSWARGVGVDTGRQGGDASADRV